MTGELVDAFANRADGVRAIARLLGARFAAPIVFFAGRAGLVGAGAVAAHSADIASANWLATAGWIARQRGDALLVDVGSTTTDVVPVLGGSVAAVGYDDADRLAAGELVYTGVTRTPVIALAPAAPLEGRWLPAMAEFFATAADVYRLTGELDERADQHPAADGGEKTVGASSRRLARMFGKDVEDHPIGAWIAVARALRDEQLGRIVRACRQVESRVPLPPDAPLVAAGCGAFLVPEVARRLGRATIAFEASVERGDVGPEAIAQCAPALATALLALALSKARSG
jgi:probable H4MPT-linked C1 transfer pathway protein